jgi:hypothetical protein
MRPSTRLEGKPKSFAIFVQFISLPILIHGKKSGEFQVRSGEVLKNGKIALTVGVVGYEQG